MKKHIKDALRAAGLPMSTPIERTGRDHFAITVAGVRVVASCTPSCPHAAANITRDLIRALSQTKATVIDPATNRGDNHHGNA